MVYMYYVYFLRSIKNSHQTYVGFTSDLHARLKEHNAGKSIHTAKFKPWELIFFIGFNDETQAKNFEIYLKTPSGKSFAAKRMLPINFLKFE
jgi:putative endonuclease